MKRSLDRFNTRKQPMIVMAGIIGLLLIGAGAWFFLLRDNDTKTSEQTPSKTQQSESVASTPADPTPTVYKSTKLNIELTHRKDWTLKEQSGGEIVLTSPAIAQLRADGTATNGVFTLKFRKGITTSMQASLEKTNAVRDSQVIGYAAPTEAQRQYTNVSYAGQGEAFQFFIVTGSVEIKADSPVANVLTFDNDTFLIAGGYGTDKGDTLSFDLAPTSAIDSTAMEQAIDIVESLKVY